MKKILFYNRDDYISRQTVNDYLGSLNRETRRRLMFDETAKRGIPIDLIISQLKRCKLSVNDFLTEYLGLSMQATDEIKELANAIDGKPLEERVRLYELFYSLQPDWEYMAPPCSIKRKVAQILSGRQYTRNEWADLKDRLDGFQIELAESYPYEMLTRICNEIGVSVHYILGLGFDDLFYGKEYFTDLVIDYYLLLPEYIREQFVLMVK